MQRLSLRDFDAVAFDFEGTLADTIPTHHKARLEAFKRHGYGHITPEQHALGPTYGTTTPTIVGGILHAAGEIDDDVPYVEHPTVRAVMATKTALYEELAAAGFQPMPGAIAFVRQIAPLFKGQMALVTSTEEKFFLPFAEQQGIRQFFPNEHIISRDTILAEGLESKPAPDPYLLAIRRLKAKHLLVFEDTVPGVVAAKQAGATVVALGFDAGSAQLFLGGSLAYPPDVFAHDYTEAARILGLAAKG